MTSDLRKCCPNCLGEGIVKLTSYLEAVTCWTCGGLGLVDEEAK